MDANHPNRPHLILVTGLLSPAWTFWRFQRHFKKQGFQVSIKSYGHLRQTAEHSARDLGDYIDTLDAPQVQLIAHSFGGVVLLHLLEQSAASRRIRFVSLVFLGCPLTGSVMADHLLSTRLGSFWRFLLGASLRRGLTGDQPSFHIDLPHALVAGTRKSILSLMLNRNLPAGDGLVTLQEALPPNSGGIESEIHRIAVTHAALLYDSDCIDWVSRFLAATRD